MLSDNRNGNFTSSEAEIWKPIEGFEGVYEISSLLRIRSLPKTEVYCGRKRGNIITTKISIGGYVRVSLRLPRKKNKMYLLHRLFATAFIPNLENKPFINHKNSIRHDNRIENLEWCTHSENNKHAHDTGRQKVYTGEHHHQSKLTKSQVDAVRSKYSYGKYTITMLSNEFGMSRYAIQAILSNKTWKDEHYTPKRKKVG